MNWRSQSLKLQKVRGSRKIQILIDVEKSSLVKTNLAIIYFHNCEYKRSNQKLLEVLDLLRLKDRKTEFR
jgi:hypothetical protein